MTDYYIKNTKFYVSVDCIIFGFDGGELKLLLLKRNFEPAMGEWSLMGGFVEDEESVNDAAKRVLRELTGLEDVYMEQVAAFGEVNRDPGERVISVAFYALININEYNRELVRKNNAFWISINEPPKLIFDHAEMVKQALHQMRIKASNSPIGFNLLPELFTLPQLQSLYEAIYGETLDKRNFRKRVKDMSFIEETGLKSKDTTRRKANLYKFNNTVYNKDSKFKL
jgi:ADP-ribose pyrophosphatase YjhB (NUDIX family)